MKFDAESFDFLQDSIEEPGYTTISKAELSDSLASLLSNGFTEEDAPDVFKAVETYMHFLNEIQTGFAGDAVSEDALTVKCDEMGVIEQVYGPAIFKGENGIPVLRVCNDFYNLVFSGSDVTCGIAVGEASVEDRETKDEDGNDTKVVQITFDGYFDLTDSSFEVPFILDGQVALPKAKVKKLFKDGKLSDINNLLKEPPSGSGWTSLNDIEIGEYRVFNIEEQKPHPEYGRSWLIFLEGIGPVMSKGARLESNLARKFAIYSKTLAANKPLTFAVSSKEPVSGGMRVNCGFFSREPRADRLVAGTQPKAMPSADVEQQPALVGAQQTLDTKAVPVTEIPL